MNVTRSMKYTPSRSLCAMLAGAGLLAALSGCAPLLIGGAALGGAMVATDRRTSGTQLEDQGIELKSQNRIRDVVGDKSHVTVTSYDRQVLLTGEVFSEADKAAIEAAVAKVENVRNVVNDLVVGWPSSASDRSRDLLLSTKVRATLVDAKDLSANAFTVLTERETVYLMGKVTEAEATRAIDLIRTISGVKKVVRLLDIITPEQLAERKPR
ncbi:BON domain-containing protein [Leptothrix discophora]|uniref:BON domain-containing protein n=1 Tax=Leptothrix discophora TaxID=89 RepID=A0ABT9G512_LEPDI|nr:BON domain-containing protein [Leptothrix discophora]MDP4301582.1 BON domain-containing protein [Leptothrix discophora]